MSKAIVLVGRGRYDDPWHDDAAVADRVRDALSGLEVSLRGTYQSSLDDVTPGSLIVVCAGRGRTDPGFDGDDHEWEPFHAQLADLVAAGSPLLGLHAAANTFADNPRWADLLGGRWVENHSMHPPRGPATFDVVGDHPVARTLHTDGRPKLACDDERYCFLDVAPTSSVLVATTVDGVDHPVAWAAASPAGHGRVIYDGLGHDARATTEPDRLALLRAEIDWLLS